MRKVILDLAVTLDGFIEGPNGEVDWCIMDEDMGFNQFLASIDTIFYGRVSYDMWGNFQPADDAPETEKSIWNAVHSKKKYVFSKTGRQDSAATWISTDIKDRIDSIKREPGKDIWLYGGANLITTFVDLGLVDMYRLGVHPTILGRGKPLFVNIKDRVDITLESVKTFQSGVVLLSYSKKRG
ncbi:MAG: dihydrofolate reductase [Williamsia sp.]|nr:dihydrofolate reductase [Williamsia sp.]